ncbi:hybrid sensor histidine kinase/response regulator transcription factor [Maribellus mangrovi]|uniref:hybrid sensor histidine kinase/response regulator transcription factor n=1 Tax=Maribellus mangrovi TaxID=3133146 RepID=UPI0030EE9F7F
MRLTDMTRLIKYQLTLFLMYLSVVISAQPEQLLKNFYTVDNGLSHNEVTSIVQDYDGFIWIGTRGGLNRYDGYDFKIFNQVPGDSNSLVNPSIESLFVDSEGNIWIGTKSGGVSKYDADKEVFSNIISNYKNKSEVLPDSRVLSFYEDKYGRIWMGTWNHGLIIYDENKKTSIRYLSGTINSIVETLNGDIWVGTGGGLYRFSSTKESVVQADQPNISMVCHEIKYDPKRNVLWIAESGLTRFDLHTYERTRYEIENVNAYESICLDNNGMVWLGTWGNGFYYFDPAKEVFQRYQIYPENRATLNKDYDAVLNIFEDKDHNLWLGTNGGGICVLTPKLDFKTVGFNPERFKGLRNTRIMTVVDDRKKNLWLGTIGSGLVWSPDRENFYPVPYPQGVNKSRFLIIKYLYEDKDGVIWVGTNLGLYVIRFRDNVPQMIRPKLDPDYENRRQIVSIIDAEDKLWLGSLMSGLYILDKTNDYKLIKSLNINDKESGNLNSDRISYLYEDNRGRIWVGTYNGLHFYDPSDTTVILAEENFEIDGEFTGNIITCIDQDIRGNLWIGTPNGLNKLSESENSRFTLKLYTEKDGLASNFIKGISGDSDGNIWISTSLGISRIEDQDQELAIRNYKETDGVGGKNFTEASVFRNQEGEIFFGGSNGLTYFNPGKIEALPTAHKPILTELRIHNEPVSIDQKYGSKVVMDQSIIHEDKIVVPYRFNNFEIRFSALDYRAQGGNLYKYKLEKYDNDWQYLGTRRFVNFNSLRAGEYELLLMSANSHNVWNTEPTTLTIEILPPFWQTWYALLFYIITIVGIVTVIRWNAVKQVRLANSLEMEKLKHRQDQKIHELRLRFFTNLSHEFRTPLTLILAPLKELLRKKEEYQLSEETEHKIKIINNNSVRLMKLINQLLDFRKLETGNEKLAASKTNLVEFVTELCYPFQELAEINNILFKTNFAINTTDLWIDRDKIEIIFNNLLSNAFNHVQENGKIEVALYEEEEEVLLTVSDNGHGIPKSELEFIFDRFYRGADSKKDGSSGIGLALAKHFAELHKGNLSVVSEPFKLTQFTLAIPKGTGHLKPDEIIEPKAEKKRSGISDVVMKNIFPDKPVEAIASDECILVVEDNREMREYLLTILAPLYHVETAENGKEGYEKALTLKPDLIVSDVMMPEMDGFEFCKKLRENDSTSTIPLIFLTAKDDEQFRFLGTQLGADDFISKPFDPVLLTEKVKNIFSRRKKLQKKYSKSVRLEPSDVEITSSEEMFIENAISIVEDNLQNSKFNSDALASEMHMSTSSLYRRLKSLTGYSTAEFIRSLRIKRAAQLMADKEKTITEIAYDVGFNDVKHFRTVFQKQFKCTPTEYRQKL